MKPLISLAILALACGGRVDESEGAAGAPSDVECVGTLLDASEQIIVAYQLGGGVVVALKLGDKLCVDVPREELCIYVGGARSDDNFVPHGATAERRNSIRCAPAA